MNEKRSVTLINILTLGLLVIIAVAMVILAANSILEEEKKETVAASDEVVYKADEISGIISDLEEKSYKAGKEDVLAAIKNDLQGGKGVNTIIREMFPEHIVYVYEQEYQFVPLSDKIAKNPLKAENFIVNDKDLSEYTIKYKDKNIESFKGIDVSKFQGNIDWQLVKEDGVDFAFVRVGYRGYETGKIVDDEMAVDNIEGAIENDIKVGVYFFTQAVNEEEAVEEAEYVIDLIKEYDIEYPVAIDVEYIDDELARTKGLSKEQYSKNVIAFLDTVKEAGYTPMIYGNMATLFSMLEFDMVSEYDKWFAYYDTELYYPYDIGIWQYSCTGKVAGIETDCDLNISFKEY